MINIKKEGNDLLTNRDRRLAVEFGKQLGIEVTFENKESGIYVVDKKVADFEDLFPEIKEINKNE